MTMSPDLCWRCQLRPIRRPLADERGEVHTVGLTQCHQCSGQTHAWGCNDPEPHATPECCTRHSKRYPAWGETL